MSEAAPGGVDRVVVAYLIQSHKNVPQVRRLVGALASLDPGSLIYVSHDARDVVGADQISEEHRARVTLDRGDRGQFAMVQRWLRAVEQVREDGGADFVVLLSGQDYPVRRLDEMRDELEQSGDGFLEYFPALSREGNHWPVREGRSRYLYRWHELCRISDAARGPLRVLHALNRVQPFFRVNVAYGTLRVGVWGNRVPRGLVCYGGSMFASLSWRSVQHVVQTVRERPDVVRWAEAGRNVDEAFFQTVLVSAEQFRFIPSSRRFYVFEGSRFGHPKTLTVEDVPAALASGAYFARKFDTTSDAAALDIVDEALGL